MKRKSKKKVVRTKRVVVVDVAQALREARADTTAALRQVESMCVAVRDGLNRCERRVESECAIVRDSLSKFERRMSIAVEQQANKVLESTQSIDANVCRHLANMEGTLGSRVQSGMKEIALQVGLMAKQLEEIIFGAAANAVQHQLGPLQSTLRDIGETIRLRTGDIRSDISRLRTEADPVNGQVVAQVLEPIFRELRAAGHLGDVKE